MIFKDSPAHSAPKVLPGSASILGAHLREEELHSAALFFFSVKSARFNTTHYTQYLHPDTSVLLLSCGHLSSSGISFCTDLRVAADGSPWVMKRVGLPDVGSLWL